MPAEGVKIKLATTNGSIAVDPFPEVDGLASQINFMFIGDGMLWHSQLILVGFG